jgi:hypothetical protein
MSEHDKAVSENNAEFEKILDYLIGNFKILIDCQEDSSKPSLSQEEIDKTFSVLSKNIHYFWD